ncbi:cyclophilin-like fold protein [Hungatella sp. SB206]
MRDTAVFLCTLMLVFAACGCSRAEAADSQPIVQEEGSADKGEVQMRIYVTSNGNTIVYGLNDSQAAKDLYAQLPLTIEVEDYSTNEKIFYPSEKLDASDAPVADEGKGTLAYYAPWGDVVMFYDHFGKSSNLYELGMVISGEEFIEALSGSVEITGENEKVEE